MTPMEGISEVHTSKDTIKSNENGEKHFIPLKSWLPIQSTSSHFRLTLWWDDLHFDLFGGVGCRVEWFVFLLCRRGSISWGSCRTVRKGTVSTRLAPSFSLRATDPDHSEPRMCSVPLTLEGDGFKVVLVRNHHCTGILLHGHQRRGLQL